MADRYHFEVLNREGSPFLRSARPWSLDEIRADASLCSILNRYPHVARTEDGDEVEGLPGFPQV